VILLVKTPVPVPSEVLESAIVGLAVVLQQTPLAVTMADPSKVTLPPLVAVVDETVETSVVDTVGRVVPAPFVSDTLSIYQLSNWKRFPSTTNAM
jgi:hypothetical protein